MNDFDLFTATVKHYLAPIQSTSAMRASPR